MTGGSAKGEANGADAAIVFAVDLGGTHLRVASVDRSGKIHFRQMQATPKAESPSEIVRAVADAVQKAGRETAELSGRRAAVSLAVPGTVNVAEGMVVKAPNLPCLDGFRLAAALEREVEWPVVLENDANAAAVGEMWQGAGRGRRTLICVTLGTGVGGGIILEGKLWRGADGAAAEIGHIGIDPFADVPCRCGSRGCLEVYASATAIVRMTREARTGYPKSVLNNREDLTSQNIYHAGIQGDELAIEVFRRMGVYLGIGLATLINILDPEIVVIGGGVSSGWDLFEQHMHQEVFERSFPGPARRVKIVRAECGDDAGLLGAAHLAFSGVSGDK